MDQIEIGGKMLRRTAGQREVARSGGWILHSSVTSPCGRYQNYKLYRDAKAAPKKVFYLGYDLQAGELCYLHDKIVLDEHYAGMCDWVASAIQGRGGDAPYFKPYNDIGKETKKVGSVLEGDVVGRILEILAAHWRRGNPLSCYSQTRKQGRYAASILSAELKLSQADVEETIGYLMSIRVIEHAVANKATKLKGLRVVKKMEMEMDNG